MREPTLRHDSKQSKTDKQSAARMVFTTLSNIYTEVFFQQ